MSHVRDDKELTFAQRLAAWLERRWTHTGGCDGKPFHNGMCECECRTHYLGL